MASDLFRFIRTFESELAQYNKSRIFNDSEDVFGKPIGFYSPATEKITEGRKKAGDSFTLFEEGDFLGSIFAKVEGEQVVFGAKDPKTPLIFENLLSTDIFGLNDEDLQRVIEERLLPFCIQYFRRFLT